LAKEMPASNTPSNSGNLFGPKIQATGKAETLGLVAQMKRGVA
jgi:hypothetical protein